MEINKRNLFKSLNLEPNGLKWTIVEAKLDVNSEIFVKVKKQALLKSKHTMDYSQSSQIRNENQKYQSQLRGCLAEEFAKLLIEEFAIKKSRRVKVVRYDNVRTDNFTSASNEYDIRVIVSDTEYFIEARSSVAHNRSILNAIESFDIIGPYKSSSKTNENPNDYYIRPLYGYIDYKNNDFYQQDLEELIDNGKVKLYFVGGTSFRQLIERGYEKSMGQGKTRYKVIKILKGYTIGKFLEIITKE
jgi:hypothetical protein